MPITLTATVCPTRSTTEDLLDSGLAIYESENTWADYNHVLTLLITQSCSVNQGFPDRHVTAQDVASMANALSGIDTIHQAPGHNLNRYLSRPRVGELNMPRTLTFGQAAWLDEHVVQA